MKKKSVIKFDDEALKSSQIVFRSEKIITIDRAMSILRRGHLDILTDLLVNKENSQF